MSTSYPIHVELRGLPVLVVGGGAVAERKVAGLIAAGGAPDVVSPEVTARLGEVIERSGLKLTARRYRSGDLAGYRLVFAATDDAGLNRDIAREAGARGTLVNVANVSGASSFRVPAVHREGGIVVSCATHGAAPALARRIRERIAEAVTPGLGRAARRLVEVRAEVRQRWPGDGARRRAFWSELMTDAFLDAASAGREEEVESMIRRCLSRS